MKDMLVKILWGYALPFMGLWGNRERTDSGTGLEVEPIGLGDGLDMGDEGKI